MLNHHALNQIFILKRAIADCVGRKPAIFGETLQDIGYIFLSNQRKASSFKRVMEDIEIHPSAPHPLWEMQDDGI